MPLSLMKRNEAPAADLSLILQEIKAFLGGSINHSASLKDDLCLDSLDIVELIVHLEEKYKVEFIGEELPPLETVNDLAQHTLSLIAND